MLFFSGGFEAGGSVREVVGGGGGGGSGGLGFGG